jgi:glucokinase
MVADNLDAPLLAIDVGGTHVRVAFTRQQKIIVSNAVRWPSHLTPAGEVAFIADAARNIIKEAGWSEPVGAAGIALAAQLDERGRVVQWPNRPAWQHLEFTPLLMKRLGIPVAVDDDANAASLAEWTIGVGRGYQNLAVIVVGTGVGAGLILNGRLFRGRCGWAGELGHTVMQHDGPVCSCGRRGCLQALASGRVLERAVTTHNLSGVQDIITAVEKRETWATQLVEHCGYWIGLAGANVANLLNLEAVVISGSLSKLPHPLWSALEDAFLSHLLNQMHQPVALHRSTIPDTAGLLGAMIIAQQLYATNRDRGR